MIRDLTGIFSKLDGFTLSEYSDWSKKESSARAYFTQISKTEETAPIKIREYLELAHHEGIGLTEVAELPVEVNPYLKDGIHILYKKEYTNPGGSGKDRPTSLMLYAYRQLGLLDGRDRITIAGAGNFARSIARYAKKLAPNIKVESRMGYVAIERNPDLIDELKELGVTIVGCDDAQCPTVLSENGEPAERGKAITDSWMEEALNPTTTVFLDQHGYWKPFDPILNSGAYYYTLGSEIIDQVKKMFGDVPFEYCQGMGTRGSLMGTAVRLLERNSEVKILGNIPKTNGLTEDHPTFQFGLRRRKELGRAYTLDTVDKLCEEIYETPDREVAKTFVALLESGIPTCPSFAGNVYACLMRARELHEKKSEGVIVTLAFDGPDFYRQFLEQTLPLLGVEFREHSKAFEDMVVLAKMERHDASSNLE